MPRVNSFIQIHSQDKSLYVDIIPSPIIVFQYCIFDRMPIYDMHVWRMPGAAAQLNSISPPPLTRRKVDEKLKRLPQHIIRIRDIAIFKPYRVSIMVVPRPGDFCPLLVQAMMIQTQQDYSRRRKCLHIHQFIYGFSAGRLQWSAIATGPDE